VKRSLIMAAIIAAGTIAPAEPEELFTNKMRWTMIDALRQRHPIALRATLLLKIYQRTDKPLVDAELFLLTKAIVTDDFSLMRAIETLIVSHRPGLQGPPHVTLESTGTRRPTTP